jgi:SAM-dependent methyltransferase
MNPITHPRYHLTNNYERSVFLKEDPVGAKETARYIWANEHITGTNILDLGCSSGFGRQFLNYDIDYLGLDYDKTIIEIAQQQNWHPKAKFQQADIHTYQLGHYDTIIAFEFIEHFTNGLAIVERLKQHCDTLLITVPYNEPKGFWGEHHLLHGLNEQHFVNFQYAYIDFFGTVTDSPRPICEINRANLLLAKMCCKNTTKII